MRFIPLVVMLGCTVGLVDETKPIVAQDTAVEDTAANDTDTTDTEDTEDSGPDIDENSENPYNGECGDNRDNDGDGLVDCADSDCAAAPECNQSADGDTDGDGYKDEVDCDPYNPYVNPGANEIDNNGIDDDCDGVTDSGTSSGGGSGGTGGNPTPGTVCSDTCTDGLGNILYGANDGTCQDGGFGDGIALILGSAACAFGTDCSDCGIRTDADGDFHEADPLGLGLALYADCDDTDPTINSSATDIPGDGIDQDCDGSDASSGGGGTTTPTSESDCTDGVDEDQDGLTDCDDSDCASDAACQSSGGGTGGCSSTEVVDCNGNCAPAYWVGDSSCDDGAYSYLGNQIDLDCATHNYDDGDCATSSGGGGSSSNCATDQVEDCNGLCIPSSWQGDGICDHSPNGVGIYGSYSMNCAALNFDDGDCPDSSAAGCASGEILDCSNTCVDELLLGNGTCDDGSTGVDLDCLTWYYDNNDC